MTSGTVSQNQPSIPEIYFGDGIGKIIGIFLDRIVLAWSELDQWLWVIVGDVPPAYLGTDGCKNPAQAPDAYTEEMSKWIARAGEDVIPVSLHPTPEWAEQLRVRLELLRKLLRPWMNPPSRADH